MSKEIISVERDFSHIPGPRYIKEGSFSGEQFRKDILAPALRKALAENASEFIIDLDGTAGYGTSFLEEAFGGLIREEKINFKQLLGLLKFVSNEEPYLIDDIWQYIHDAHENNS